MKIRKNIKLNKFVVCKHNAKTHKMLIKCSEKFYILTLICNLLRIKESFLLSWIDNFGRGVVESNEILMNLWYILPRSDWNYHLKIFKECTLLFIFTLYIISNLYTLKHYFKTIFLCSTCYVLLRGAANTVFRLCDKKRPFCVTHVL